MQKQRRLRRIGQKTKKAKKVDKKRSKEIEISKVRIAIEKKQGKIKKIRSRIIDIDKIIGRLEIVAVPVGLITDMPRRIQEIESKSIKRVPA